MSSLKKAKIKFSNGKKSGTTIDCEYNPQTYRVNTGARYKSNSTKLNYPVKQYAGPADTTFKFKLFFDTTDQETSVKDEYIDDLRALTEVDGSLHAPPRCEFVWGSGPNFEGYVTDLSIEYVRFTPDGTRTRAWADTTFEKFKKGKSQQRNIKFESTDKMKVWTVTEGDTLWHIAAEEYDDPSHWRTIAKANDMTNPRSLEPGTKLSLPPL